MNNQQVLDLFVDQNVLQKTQADDVLTEAQQNGKTIVQALVDGGYMDESGFLILLFCAGKERCLFSHAISSRARPLLPVHELPFRRR